jgi:transposase
LTRRQVAADLGVGFSTLSKWIQLGRRDEVLSAPQEDLAKENDRLRREVRLFKEERDLLKKATAFFAPSRRRFACLPVDKGKAHEICFCR